MKPQELKCKVIAELYWAGNNAKAIINTTMYARSIVFDVIKHLKAGKGVAHAPCGPHKAKKRTPTFLAHLKRSVDANPVVSMASHARCHGVNAGTVGRAIKEDLKLTTYIRGHQHLLTEKT